MSKNKEMSFLDHLEELRWHILRVLVAVLICMIFSFVFKTFLFEKIIFAPQKNDFFSYRVLCKIGQFFTKENLCNNNFSFIIINLSMAGQFITHLKVSFFTGIIISFPYALYELWLFIKPGLYDNERKYSLLFGVSGLFLFICGVSFAYFIITPISMQFLINYSVSNSITNTISLENYISFLSSLILAGGILFEMPLFIYFLTKVGLVNEKALKEYRKHAIVIILFLSALITPPDVSSQIILSLPLFLLYEISIVISKKVS